VPPRSRGGHAHRQGAPPGTGWAKRSTCGFNNSQIEKTHSCKTVGFLIDRCH
jgi:hypothetical protein